MSLCKLNHVGKAQKDQGRCQICGQAVRAGDAYKWWKGRFTPRYVAHAGCTVPAYRRETNPLRSDHMAAADEVSEAMSATSPESAAEHLRSAMDMVQGVVDELEGRIDGWSGTNLEYSQQSEACQQSRDELQDWLDRAEEWAYELENLDPEPAEAEDGDDDPDAHGDWQESFDEAQGAIEDIPDLDLGA